jgi:hypothetical protein
MKTSFLSIHSFIGILSSSSLSILFFLSIASIYNIHAVTYDFNFAAVGDWGCNSNTDAIVKGIANTKTTNKLGAAELVLGLGDYSYQPTANCWLNKVASIDDNMKITIGNHENSAKTGFNQYKKSFGLTSNAYYSFDFQNVHFIIMNTQTPYTAGSSQYNFIKDDLSKADKNDNINWIIVVMHEPFYTSPTSCKIKSCQGIGNLRDTYHPLFDTYKVDLVLGAHLHDYQRSFPLEYNSASSSKPIMTSKIPSKYNDPKGEIYVIVGTGGINFHKIIGKNSYIVKQQSSFFGHLNVDITNKGQVLTAKFIQNNGKVFDAFSITK